MTKSAITPYPLRLDPELRKRLEHVAKHAGRSLQAEIAARLEQSLEDDIQRFIAGGDNAAPQLMQIDSLADVIVARLAERLEVRTVEIKPSGVMVATLDPKPIAKRRTPPKPKA